MPSRSVTTSESGTSTAQFSCPVTTEASSTRQVQVATQTTLEKKLSIPQSTYPPLKGKKGRYQILPRQHNANFTSQNSYQVDPNTGGGLYMILFLMIFFPEEYRQKPAHVERIRFGLLSSQFFFAITNSWVIFFMACELHLYD